MCDVDNELSDQNKPQERSLSCCSCSFQLEDIHIGLDRCYVEKSSWVRTKLAKLKTNQLFNKLVWKDLELEKCIFSA